MCVIQPGELATRLSFSAPIPLGLFFLWIYVLGMLRGIEIHPVNYLFNSLTPEEYAATIELARHASQSFD